MVRKPLNVAKVKLQVTAPPELRAEVIQSAERAGLSWPAEGAEVLECELQRVCKMTCHAALVDIAKNWTPDQWRAARARAGCDDVSHNHPTAV